MNEKAMNVINNLESRGEQLLDRSRTSSQKLWSSVKAKSNDPRVLWGTVGAIALIGGGIAYNMLRKK